MGGQELLLAGERIWNLERLYNNRAGLSRKDDTLPPRMTREPLTNGAVQNQVVELAKWRSLKLQDDDLERVMWKTAAQVYGIKSA